MTVVGEDVCQLARLDLPEDEVGVDASLTSDVLLQQRELEPLLLWLLRLLGLLGLVGLGGGRGWRGLRRHDQQLGVVRRGEDGRQVRCRGRGQLDGLGLCFRDGLGLLNGLR